MGRRAGDAARVDVVHTCCLLLDCSSIAKMTFIAVSDHTRARHPVYLLPLIGVL